MNDSQQLADNLRLLMARTGMDSQLKLSHASGVSQTQIGNILRCERSPSQYTMGKLADALGVATWQVQAPGDLLDRQSAAGVSAVVNSYLAADPAGRQVILRVAEAQSAYHIDDPEPPADSK